MEDKSPEEVIAESMNRWRGRCCGLVESWGLDDRRTRAMIQTLKSLSYDTQREITEVIDELIAHD